jgi:hypothetical protein
MEVSGQLRAPAALPQGKSPWYQLDRRLGESQSRSGRGGEEINSHPLPGLESPIIQPIVQMTYVVNSDFSLRNEEFCDLYLMVLLRQSNQGC